ncbi:MAG: hypothetical protein ACLRFE_03930, partial [Clostridia bacterium]
MATKNSSKQSRKRKTNTALQGKTRARFLAVGAAAGVVSLAILGSSISNKLSNRPLGPENPYDNSFMTDNFEDTTPGYETDNLVQEPSINTEEITDAEIDSETNTDEYVDFETETTLPELEEPVVTEPVVDKDELGAEFTDVLAKLTNKSKDYINAITGSTPNLTITGFSAITIDSNNCNVLLLGQANIGGKFNNFTSTMTNTDVSLEIYNLSSDNVTEDAFISALDQLLSSETTEFKLQLKQHFDLSNKQDVIDTILNTRLDELTALNSDNQAVLDEISHINKLLTDTSGLKLNVLLNNRTSVDGGYNYSFTVSVNTGKYFYTSDNSFVSKRILATTALKQTMEAHLTNPDEFSINAIPSTAVNQALHII